MSARASWPDRVSFLDMLEYQKDTSQSKSVTAPQAAATTGESVIR